MKKGDFVRVNYVGRLESGEIFDLTDEAVAKKEGLYNSKISYKPVPVVVGEGFMIKGIDKALLSMSASEKKELEVTPEEGFGQRDARLVRTMPRAVFSEQRLEPRPGMIVDFAGTKGRVQSVSSGRVRVDFNNPLAGKKLKYEIEVTGTIEASDEKIKALLEFFGAEGAVSIEGGEAKIAAALPHQLRGRISDIILRTVGGIDKVTFTESYGRGVKKSGQKAGAQSA